MKTLRWITLLVFVLGIAVGNGISHLQRQDGGELTSFATQPHTQKPTKPEAEQVGATADPTGFPFALEYTSLVAEKLIAYEGAYLSGGVEENVENVAALVLSNTGTTGIEYAQVVLVQNGRELFFDATYIPPKSKVLVLEENKQVYSDAPVTQCRCRTVIPGVFDWMQRSVKIEEIGMSTLNITNLTDQKLPSLRIFYKIHEGASDMYVGGITYSVVIPELEPGQSESVTPYRYAAGYAKVVAVIPQ